MIFQPMGGTHTILIAVVIKLCRGLVRRTGRSDLAEGQVALIMHDLNYIVRLAASRSLAQSRQSAVAVRVVRVLGHDTVRRVNLLSVTHYVVKNLVLGTRREMCIRLEDAVLVHVL